MASGKEIKTTITLEGSVGESLKKAFDTASGMADKSSKHINGVMGKLGGFASGAMKAGFTAAAAGITAVGTAAVAGAKAAIDLGQSFEQASNTIRIGTGATGEALDDLNKSFDEVYKSVPTTMEAASQAIADYNTRLGLTGPELEGISKQAIQVSNLLGDDLTSVIEESSQAFQQWDISAEDMGSAMDYVFKAAQSTGVGFTDLMSGVQQYGAQMKEMGFSFEETTSLLGQLDKAGINSGEVMGALKKSVGAFAKEGMSASEGLTQYITKIQEAGSAAEATAIASEVFGARAGSTMAAAIRDGKLSVSELTAELMASDETIMKAAEDTETFPQKLQKLKATAEVALKPVVNNFMDIANKAIPMIGDAAEKVIPEISGFLSELAPVFGDAIGAIIPMLSNVIQKVTPLLKDALAAVPGIIANIKGAVSRIMPIIQSAIPMVKDGITAVQNAISSAMPYVQQIVDAAIPAFQSMGAAIIPIATTLVEQIFPVLQQIGGLLISTLTPIITQIFNTITTLMPTITPLIQSAITMLGALYTNVLLPIGSFLAGGLVQNIQNILNVVTPVVNGIMIALRGLLDFLTGVFTGDWQRAWEGIKTIFNGVWETMKAIVRGVINTIINGINNILRGINSTIEALGGKALETIGIKAKIPLIPNVAFAKGGTVTSPTVALVGEGGEPETIIPHNSSARSKNLVNEAIRGVYGAGATITNGGSDNRSYTINFSPVIEGAGLTDKRLQDAFEEFKRNMTAFMEEQERESFA